MTSLFTENPKEFTIKLQKNKFSKVVRYKSNIENSIVFLHTSSEQFKNRIRESSERAYSTIPEQRRAQNPAFLYFQIPGSDQPKNQCGLKKLVVT
jgi:hypothetical protein